LALIGPVALGDSPEVTVSQLFPERAGTFKRVQLPGPPDALKQQGVIPAAEEPLGGQAEYVSPANEKFLVEIVRFHQEAEAYSLLSIVAALDRQQKLGNDIGVSSEGAGFDRANQFVFCKGIYFVRITSLKPEANSVGTHELAVALTANLARAEDEIPVLVKHLPNSDAAQKTAIFLTRFSNLQTLIPNQSVLSVVETGGDADATLAGYDSGKVLIVEYNTPQLATENDHRIVAKIQELWKAGQPAPKAYRRVGNYSVFVFDAQTDEAAKQLLDQVKYEQVVQWLGQNPYIFKEAERRYVETTLGVFIAVVKASGVALIACFGLGGLFGALLFSRRRAQQRTVEAFSDAGGMLRLNLDEMTPQTDPTRLIRERN
jgi:hypothetical protein